MITTRSDFEREMRTIDRLVDRNAELPRQVFRGQVSAFYVIDIDELWAEEFFRDAQRLTARAGDSSFTFAVLKPDPDHYFYGHFKRFPFLRFCNTDSAGQYIASLHEDPGDSPADAIAYNSETIFIYPASARWAIYGDRNLEIGIVATMDEEMTAAFTSTSESLRLFTPTEALTQLLPPVYRGVVPNEVKESFVQNYSAGVATT